MNTATDVERHHHVAINMNKTMLASLIITFVVGIVVSTAAQSDTTRIVVGLNSADSNARAIDIVRNDRGILIREMPRIGALIFNVPTASLDRLKSNPELKKHIKYIENDVIMKIPENGISSAGSNVGAKLVPSDPLFQYQWGMPMIEANTTWDINTGDPSIIVAVVDTGADYNHEDLNANVNPSLGWDFVNNDADAMDDNGHGTHVAGIIAAEINNGAGVVGVAPNVTVMPVKVLDASGSGFSSDVADGIIWAADHGAKVISMSLGSWVPSSVVETATKYAVYNKSALVIAAAGNDGLPIKTYPAAYSWVIAVAALDSTGNRAWYSNYGNWVDISAPGGNVCNCAGDILSTWPGNQYKYLAGTSMATPHVSGVAALYWSFKPSLTNAQVGRALLKHADDLGAPGRDPYYGFGRVDAYPQNG